MLDTNSNPNPQLQSQQALPLPQQFLTIARHDNVNKHGQRNSAPLPGGKAGLSHRDYLLFASSVLYLPPASEEQR